MLRSADDDGSRTPHAQISGVTSLESCFVVDAGLDRYFASEIAGNAIPPSGPTRGPIASNFEGLLHESRRYVDGCHGVSTEPHNGRYPRFGGANSIHCRHGRIAAPCEPGATHSGIRARERD